MPHTSTNTEIYNRPTACQYGLVDRRGRLIHHHVHINTYVHACVMGYFQMLQAVTPPKTRFGSRPYLKGYILIFLTVETLSRFESPTARDMPLIRISHEAFPSLPSSPIDDPGVLEAGWVFNQVTTSSEFATITYSSEAHQRSNVSCRYFPC